LQEQPPPPKLWDPSQKQEKMVNDRTAASIKGHTAILPAKKISKPQEALQQKIKEGLNGPAGTHTVTSSGKNLSMPQETLQQKIDEALNGSGTAVEGDATLHLKVSDVDPPITSHTAPSNNPPSIAKDENKEVESITKGKVGKCNGFIFFKLKSVQHLHI